MRPELPELPQRLHGLVRLAQLELRAPRPAVRLGARGIEAGRLHVRLHRAGRVPGLLEELSELQVRPRVRRQEGHGPLEVLAPLGARLVFREEHRRQLVPERPVAGRRRHRRAQRLDRVVGPPQLALERREALRGRLVLRVALDRLAQHARRLDEATELLVGVREREHHDSVQRVDAARVLERVDGLGVPLEDRVGPTEVGVRVGLVRGAARRLLHRGQGREPRRGRFFGPPEAEEQPAAGDANLDEVGIEIEGLRVGLDGRRVLPRQDAEIPEELLRLGVLRPDPHARGERLACPRRVARPERRRAEAQERLGVVRLERRRGLERLGRLAPPLEALEGRREADADREVAGVCRRRGLEGARGLFLAPEERVEPPQKDLDLARRSAERQGLLVPLDRLFVLPEPRRRLGQPSPGLDALRVGRDRSPERGARRLPPPELHVRQTRALERRGVGGPAVEGHRVGSPRPLLVLAQAPVHAAHDRRVPRRDPWPSASNARPASASRPPAASSGATRLLPSVQSGASVRARS